MADAGKVVITPKGKYSSTATYEWLDEVTYDGKAYVALKTVTGVTPSDDGVNWRLYLDPNDIVAGDLVPTFTEANERSNIVSGESLSTILGKVKKWFTDLKGHAFNDTVKNLTTETTGSALDASQGKVLKDEVDGINRNLTQLEVSDIAGGKNLLKNVMKSQTLNGVEFTVNDDGSITFIGTATADISLTINQITLPNGTYIYNGSSAYQRKNDGTWYKTLSDGDTFNITDTYNIIHAIIWISSGTTVNKTIYPMIRKANITDDTYEPYIPSVKMITKEVSAQNASLGVLGKCKNLLNPTLQTSTLNGVTLTNNGDGTYTLNGTNSNNYDGLNLCNINLIKGKTYKWIGQNIVGRIWFEVYDDDVLVYNNSDIINSFTFEVPTTKTYTISIGYIPNEIYSGIFKPMITTNLNATYDDFVPYTGDGDTLTHDVADVKNDLGGLSFSVSGTTLSITDGTNTWTLSQ